MTRFARVLIFILATIPLVACTPSPTTGDFNSDNPEARLFATRRAGETRDRTKIPDLVRELESDDPVARMMSIKALEQITGERLGYNPYADAVSRQQAVDAWHKAVEEHRFDAPAH